MQYLDLKENQTQTTVQVLDQLLADYHLYYQKLRNFHWNIQGRQFYRLHEVFEELYEEAHNNIDEIAERILTLGQSPTSTLEEYLNISQIDETTDVHDGEQMVLEILNDFKILIAQKRTVIDKAEDANDDGTADMITGFLMSMEKQGWMLNSWLKS